MSRDINIDPEECVGCEACVEMCPNALEYDESLGCVRVVNPDGATPEEIEKALEICPVQCIEVTE